MHELIQLEHRMREVSKVANDYGCFRAANQLLEVSRLLNSQRFEPFLVDLIPPLLDPGLFRQEIDVTTKRRMAPWYTTRNILILLLLVFTFLALLLATTAFLDAIPNVV